MSFFPEGFDPRADVVVGLSLVSIDTPDGLFRFLLGGDGVFRDIDGHEWWGATVLDVPAVPLPIGGTAPEGAIGMSFFQDPSQPELIDQVRALGSDYVRGRAITYWLQPLGHVNHIYAPVWPPLRLAAFEMRSVSLEVSGPQMRRMMLKYESAFAGRNTARGWYYSTADHEKLLGAPNPSLSRMPTDGRVTEPMF